MDEIMTAAQVADLLQIHPRTVYKLVRGNSIPGRKFGGGWRFRKSEIMAMISAKDGIDVDPVQVELAEER